MYEWKMECIGTRHFQQKEISINLQDSKVVQHGMVCLIKAYNLAILAPSLF